MKNLSQCPPGVPETPSTAPSTSDRERRFLGAKEWQPVPIVFLDESDPFTEAEKEEIREHIETVKLHNLI